jgi:hypothetical protein
MEVEVVVSLFAQEDVLMLDVSDAVDRELEVELRRAENGGREVESEVEELPEEGVLNPYLREGVWEGERGSSQWRETLRRRKKMRKMKRREALREEVARVERGEVTAVEVFEEKMKKRVEGKVFREAGERRRAEKRWKKKEAWLKRMKEGKAVAIAAKRVAAGKVPPPGCAPGPVGFGVNGAPTGARCSPAGKAESVVKTLLGRVTALEERLEVQEVREKRRVKEAYEQGRKDGMAWQVRQGEDVERAQKVRRLTWELEEEKRKGLLKRRSLEGVGVKDRLAVRCSRLPRPVVLPAVKGTVVRAASQWRDYGEKWEAAKKKKDEADKALKAMEDKKAEEDRRWDLVEPREQRMEAGRGVRRPGPGRGGERGARRTGPGRGALRPTFGVGQTDVRLGESGVCVVVDRE